MVRALESLQYRNEEQERIVEDGLKKLENLSEPIEAFLKDIDKDEGGKWLRTTVFNGKEIAEVPEASIGTSKEGSARGERVRILIFAECIDALKGAQRIVLERLEYPPEPVKDEGSEEPGPAVSDQAEEEKKQQEAAQVEKYDLPEDSGGSYTDPSSKQADSNDRLRNADMGRVVAQNAEHTVAHAPDEIFPEDVVKGKTALDADPSSKGFKLDLGGIVKPPTTANQNSYRAVNTDR